MHFLLYKVPVYPGISRSLFLAWTRFTPRPVLAAAGSRLEAIQVLDRFSRVELEVLVPDLFWPELGNTLWKAARSGRITKAPAAEGLDFFVGFGADAFSNAADG
jgi:hypothetical protein